MKIISIHRDSGELSLPDVFIVGSVPIIGDEVVEHNPAVKSIVFYETGGGNGKGYRGPCYVVSFVDSHVKRIIPANTIKEIAYEAEKEKKTDDADPETELRGLAMSDEKALRP